jgi:hypothetical protein
VGEADLADQAGGAPTVSPTVRRCAVGRTEPERHAFGAGASHGLDDVRLGGLAYKRVGPVLDGGVEGIHAGAAVGVVGTGRSKPVGRDRGAQKPVMIAELSVSLDGVRLSGPTTQPSGR